MPGTAAHLKPHHFQPGQSGNPNGRPAKALNAIELAKRYAPPAMIKLAELAGLVPGVEPAMFESTRLAACKEILDRALGRPAQTVLGDADKPVVVRFQWQSALEGTNNSTEQLQPSPQLTITTEWSETEEHTDDASAVIASDEG